MWKNVAVPGRPQMTIWSRCIACWMTKATDTHSGYVVLLPFRYNNACTKAPHCYVIRTLPVVLILSFQVGLSLKVSEYNFVYIPHLLHAFYITPSPHTSCLSDLPKNFEASQYVIS
jgi:hypothetical protein